jgi:hypothetical protein
LVAGLCFGLLCAVYAWADEEEQESAISLDKAPQAVQDTINKEAGADVVKDIDVITKGDETIYKAEWTENGKEIDLKVASDGKIISKQSDEADEEKGKNEKDEENEQEGDNEG